MDKVFEMYKTSRNLVFSFLSKEPQENEGIAKLSEGSSQNLAGIF